MTRTQPDGGFVREGTGDCFRSVKSLMLNWFLPIAGTVNYEGWLMWLSY